MCSCKNGYLLNVDKKTCAGTFISSLPIEQSDVKISILDINECAMNNGNCSQICSNTIESYMCSCTAGFVLNVDGKTCDGEHI